VCVSVCRCVRKKERQRKNVREEKKESEKRDSMRVQVYVLGGSDAGIWHERQYVHASKFISIYTHTCVYTCINLFIYANDGAHTYLFIKACVCVCACIYVCMRVCACVGVV